MAFKLFDRVQESTTSTGTGDLSLGGAVTGFSTFASRYSTGDTLYYAAHAVDASGVPTGEWEVGLGTYSAASTLTRTTVMASSNSDAAVSFSAGTKRVFVTMTALQGASILEKLTAARTYYVRTDGSDSNNGLANTSGGAFLTIQKAVDVVSGTLEIPYGIEVTIKIADGTYTGSITVSRFIGNGTLKIEGNTSTPENVLISVTSNTAFYFISAASVTLTGVKITTTTSGYAVVVGDWSNVTLGVMNFGAAANGHIAVTTWSVVNCSSNYTISGSAPAHLFIISGSRFICIGKTVTLTGTPAFATAYISQSSISTSYLVSSSYSGSATGKRYDITQNSICESGTTLPGGTAGTTATGGQYS